MTRFLDDRAPLEFGQGSKRQRIMVCPKCKTGRYENVNCFSLVCVCGHYFNEDTSLSEDDAESFLSSKPINKAFTELKADMEKKAYEWRDEQIKKKKAGTLKTHEPRE